MRLIVCSAGESGKAPVPFPRTPKNLGFVSAKELPLVHLPTPHALTTSHRSRKAAGSKGLEGSSWEMWSTNKLPGRKQERQGRIWTFDAAPQGRFSDGAAQWSYIPLAQSTAKWRSWLGCQTVICKIIKCSTLVYQTFPMWLCTSLNEDSSHLTWA